ncbi:MAG: DUF4321 domain-containing protein [Syntrophaceticus schinkii]|jgi:hypothetical protein
MMKGSYRSPWLLVILLILGGILGSLIGDLLSGIPALRILATARSIGLPVTILHLDVLTLTLGFTVKINLFGVLGFILAFLIYRRL